MSDSEEPKPDWFRVIAAGIVTAATLTYAGWLGSTILSVGDDFDKVNDRLTRIEVTIVENRAERQSQINDLRSRVDRIEDRMEIGRLNRNGMRQ